MFGATGYAGSAIAAEAARRGNEVVGVSRHEPKQPIEQVAYIEGSLGDDLVRQQAITGADVIVGALSARGDIAGKMADLYKILANTAVQSSARLIIVGGFGSMRIGQDGPLVAESDTFPEDYRAEARELASVASYLKNEAPEGLDWTYISPAANFGAFNTSEPTGSYQILGDVTSAQDAAESDVSAGDFATAVLDEIENPNHQREHIMVKK